MLHIPLPVREVVHSSSAQCVGLRSRLLARGEQHCRCFVRSAVSACLPSMLVQQQRFTCVLNLGDGATKVKGFREDNLKDLSRYVLMVDRAGAKGITYLLHVDTVRCAAEDQTSLHGFGEATCLLISR